ncbi:MAG TPA: Crp/Fnr family transcriptional regulator [Candidatus Dormibacteraeota bacterium]|nr:Crp/Fnr family transcriptional regulator [Candidatus Dormibacteraeota bacterium]
MTHDTRQAPPANSFAACLTAAELADLRSRGHTRHLRRGATIFSEGQVSDRVALISSGRVKVASMTDAGEELLLALRGPGDLLGELSAIDGEPRSATVSALEPLEVLLVDAGEFNAFLRANPSVMFHLLRLLSGRLRDADRKRVEFGSFDTLGRVAHRLVELVETFGEPSSRGIRIAIPLTQLELAGWIGASREAVSKALRVLRSTGLIETHRSSIVVLDVESLRRHF